MTTQDEKAQMIKKPDHHLFFDLALDALCILENPGIFVEVNDSWQQMTGWSREEMLHRQIGNFVHTEDQDLMQSALGKLADEKEIFAVEIRFRTVDHKFLWLTLSGRCHESRAYLIVRNITEQHRDRERLNRAQAVATVGSWELDVATRVIWGSDEAFKIYGLGKNEESILPPDIVKNIPIEEDRSRLD